MIYMFFKFVKKWQFGHWHFLQNRWKNNEFTIWSLRCIRKFIEKSMNLKCGHWVFVCKFFKHSMNLQCCHWDVFAKSLTKCICNSVRDICLQMHWKINEFAIWSLRFCCKYIDKTMHLQMCICKLIAKSLNLRKMQSLMDSLMDWDRESSQTATPRNIPKLVCF